MYHFFIVTIIHRYTGRHLSFVNVGPEYRASISKTCGFVEYLCKLQNFVNVDLEQPCSAVMVDNQKPLIRYLRRFSFSLKGSLGMAIHFSVTLCNFQIQSYTQFWIINHYWMLAELSKLDFFNDFCH